MSNLTKQILTFHDQWKSSMSEFCFPEKKTWHFILSAKPEGVRRIICFTEKEPKNFILSYKANGVKRVSVLFCTKIILTFHDQSKAENVKRVVFFFSFSRKQNLTFHDQQWLCSVERAHFVYQKIEHFVLRQSRHCQNKPFYFLRKWNLMFGNQCQSSWCPKNDFCFPWKRTEILCSIMKLILAK